MLSQDFRRALDLRSTWFSVRVLQLEAASGRGLAKAGGRTVLHGFIRRTRQGAARAEVKGHEGDGQAGPGGSNGRFSSRSTWRTTSYRLATPVAAGAAVTVNALTFSYRSYTAFTSAGLPSSDAPDPRSRGPVAALLGLARPPSPGYVHYGLQDDAWLVYGPGTLDERLGARPDRLQLVRFTIPGTKVEKVAGRGAGGVQTRSSQGYGRSRDRTGRDALRRATLGHGGRAPGWAPTSGSTFAVFASAARQSIRG